MSYSRAPSKATFIIAHTPMLFSRFMLSYRYAFNCADYYITDVETGVHISKEILFVLDPREHCLVVSRFYPEIYRQNHSKYLSATCFYLLIHHFVQVSHMRQDATIYLTAKQEVFKKFYAKLKDFDFQSCGQRTDPYVGVTSSFVCGDSDILRTTGRWLDLIVDLNNPRSRDVIC